MGAVSGLMDTYDTPNYVGELFSITPKDTPFLSMIGGLTGGRSTKSKQFTCQTVDNVAASQPAIVEGADATFAGRSRSDARVRATELLATMNLSARAEHRPGQLSGGEQQRIAIARALANKPAVLLADEPTGNLDLDTSDFVFAELVGIARKEGLAALIVTHNPALAARMDRTVRLDHGLLTPL